MTDSSEFTYDGWPTTGAVRGVVISSRAKIVGEDQAAAEFDGWLADFEQNVRSDERAKVSHDLANTVKASLTGEAVDAHEERTRIHDPL